MLYIIVYHYILSDIISKKQKILLKQRILYFAEAQAVQYTSRNVDLQKNDFCEILMVITIYREKIKNLIC